MTLSDVTGIGADIASIAAVLGAGAWFVYTTQFKQRLQFDVDCRFVRLPHNPRALLAELQFIFENKGFVEHRLWNLTVSVHALEEESRLEAKAATQEIQFQTRVLPKTELVPKQYGYYFVRPGVRQVITHIIEVPVDLSVIRVTASFEYNRDKEYPHTVRRIFSVPHTGEGISSDA
jgi:hypothetical protein